MTKDEAVLEALRVMFGAIWPVIQPMQRYEVDAALTRVREAMEAEERMGAR